MATTAYLAYGSLLYWSTDTGNTYNELADIKEMGSPGDPDSPEVDITPLANGLSVREFKAGLATMGTFQFKQFWTKTRLAALLTQYRVGVLWKVIFPDNATPSSASNFVFAGYLKKCTTEGGDNPDSPLLISCEVKLTGTRVFTAGS